MFVLEIGSAVQESQTIDEGVHLYAGYSYWQHQKIEVNPEHPPLVKMLAAFPLLFMDINFPWSHEEIVDQDQWEMADTFLYELGNPLNSMLFWARLPIMLLSLLLGFFIFKWSKEITKSNFWGIFALILYAFNPTIIAHSRYITTDMGISCFIFLSLYYFYRFLFLEKMKDLVFFSISIALALMTKFSALVFGPPMLVILFVIKYFKKNINYLYLLLISGSIIILIGTALYFFEPLIFSKGFGMVQGHNKDGHESYLMGEYRTLGWWYYFPLAFLIKNTIPFLIITLGSLFLMIPFFASGLKKGEFNKNKARMQLYLILLLPTAFYMVISIMSSINLGVRHLLPIFPLLIMMAVITLDWWFKQIRSIKFKQILIGLIIFLLACNIISVLLIYPNFLAYFNIAIGGPGQGEKYLMDSNIDWGQDLKKVRPYLEKNGIDETVYIAYHGRGEPHDYNLNYKNLNTERREGYLIISKSFLYYKDKPFAWLERYEPTDVIGGSINVYDFR